MTKPKLILCNEQKLLQEEKERLRKMRLNQVREISKQSAAHVREAFRKEKEKEIKQIMAKQIIASQKQKSETLTNKNKHVQAEIANIGQGHVNAANYVSFYIK
jgi:hypothetical protein